MTTLTNACLNPPLPAHPRSKASSVLGKRTETIALDAAALGDEWMGDFDKQNVTAVVTAAWIRQVLVVIVLLTRGRERIGLVLDPCDAELAEAVSQWRTRASMNLVKQLGREQRVQQVPVHVDGVVDAALLDFGVEQGPTAVASATDNYSVVESVVGHVADTWRISWTRGKVLRLS